MDRMSWEIDNVRGALQWAIDNKLADAFRIAPNLGKWWVRRALRRAYGDCSATAINALAVVEPNVLRGLSGGERSRLPVTTISGSVLHRPVESARFCRRSASIATQPA